MWKDLERSANRKVARGVGNVANIHMTVDGNRRLKTVLITKVNYWVIMYVYMVRMSTLRILPSRSAAVRIPRMMYRHSSNIRCRL